MENMVFVNRTVEKMKLDAQKLSLMLASEKKILKKNRPKEGSEREGMNEKMRVIDERICRVKAYIREIANLQNAISRYKNERATIVRDEIRMRELRASAYCKTIYKSPSMSFYEVRDVKTPFQYVLGINVDVEDL